MSLKAFHIVFIAASVMLSLTLGCFALRNYLDPAGTRWDLIWSLASFGGGAVLVVYGNYFLKKLRNISYL